VIDKPFDRALLHTIHSAGYRLADLDAETPGSKSSLDLPRAPLDADGHSSKSQVAFSK